MTNKEFGFFIWLTAMLPSWGCSQQAPPRIQIEWRHIINTGKKTNFCQVDYSPSDSSLVVSFAHSFALSGGFGIIKASLGNGSNHLIMHDEGKKRNISFVVVKDGLIGCIRGDFDNKTLRTMLLFRNDNGTWSETATPMNGVRKFVLSGGYLLVEGSLDGSGMLLQSSDFGRTWSRIDYFERGKAYWNFYLAGPSGADGEALGEATKAFFRRRRLVLVDIQESTITDLLRLNASSSYLKPINKDEGLHAVLHKSSICLYSYSNKKMHFKSKIILPKSIGHVENLYINDKFCLITSTEGKLFGKKYTWISHDKGRRWYPFEQEKEFQIVFSRLGDLFVIDSNNDIWLADFKN